MLKVIKINNFGEIDVKDSLIKLSVMFTGVWCINKIYDLSKLFLPKCSKIIRYTPMFKKQINSVYEQMEQTIFESWSYKKDKLPYDNMTPREIMELITLLPTSNFTQEQGKISGTIYHGGEELTKLVNKVTNHFQWSNPLHADIFPEIRQMESEVIKFCSDLYENNENIGSITSGGTESILLACKSYRDKYKFENNVNSPEIIAFNSVHVAVDKACHYLDIKLIKVEVDITTSKCKDKNHIQYNYNLEKVTSLINSNTILIIGSAPSFPHGIVDPIAELALIAKNYNIGFHMDACLGGFILPFMDNNVYNFKLPGLTSISIDTHKYGYGPKGSSVILYKNKDLIHYQYFISTDWPGGIYISPTIAGSRNGSIIAGTWAAMLYFGKKKYTEITNKLLNYTQYLVKELEKMEDIYIIGKPNMTVIGIGSNKFDIYKLYQYMVGRNWNLNSLQFPPSLHICITYLHIEHDTGKQFIKDLKDGIEEIMNSPDRKCSGMGAIYGTSQKIPDRSIINEIGNFYQDLYYKI